MAAVSWIFSFISFDFICIKIQIFSGVEENKIVVFIDLNELVLSNWVLAADWIVLTTIQKL